MRPLALLFALTLLASGCPSAPEPAPDGPRVVPRVEPEAPRTFRFELVETAVLTTGSPARKVDMTLPVASTDPGVQTIESMLVRITPDMPYDVVKDGEGNRSLVVHAQGAASISCEIAYQVERFPVKVDLAKEEVRPLTDSERRLFAHELRPGAVAPAGVPFSKLVEWQLQVERNPVTTFDAPPIEKRLCASGVPARSCCGLSLEQPDVEWRSWIEAYVPGVGWAPFAATPGELPLRILVLGRGLHDPRGSEHLRVNYISHALPAH